MVVLALSLWYFAGSTETRGNDRVAANHSATGKPIEGGKSSLPLHNTESNEHTEAPHDHTDATAETQSHASQRYAPSLQQGEVTIRHAGMNDPASTIQPQVNTAGNDIRQGETLPEQPSGTISATAGTVSPLNPLPFGYELDEVGRRLPDAKLPRPARFYAQLSVGAGQSAQRNVIGSSDFLHYYAVGGGLYTRVDNMVLTFGLNGRVDFTDNIVRTVGTETPGNRIETSYKQLYSIETPASLGYTLGRNVITATVTPGFQTGFSGQEREYVAETQVRSEQTSGKIKNSRTLTMEFGLSYWRVLQPDWQIGAAVNFDALRPFNNSLFAGEQRIAPLNGQLILRRTF
jgi:hypothetical protein